MFTVTSKGLLLAIAAGFAAKAAALPHGGEGFLKVRTPPSAPALPAPEVFPPLKGKREEQGFGGLSGLLSYDDAEYGFGSNNNNVEGGDVIEIAQANITTIAADDDTVVIQQIQQTLIQASSSNSIKDEKRVDFYQQQESEQSTVLLVVQQIQILQIDQSSSGSYDYGLGYALDPSGFLSAFALSALTANEGMGSTETIMITQVEILTATIIVTQDGNGGTGIGTGFVAGTGNAGTGYVAATGAGAGAGTGLALGTGAAGTGVGTGLAGTAAGTGAAGTGAAGTGAAAAETTKTVTVTITDVAPSWTSTAPDPAETIASLVNGLVGDLLDGLIN